jgi:hypothetical protein
MRTVRFLFIALFGLLIFKVPSFAQSVSMTICNAGKVDLDAYLVQSGSVSRKHVAPAECALLAEADESMAPGTIGFGFGDAKGQQWSGARRTDIGAEFEYDRRRAR